MPSLDQPIPTPTALGYRMPAEWEPHSATWIAWPHNESDWPGKFETIPWAYAAIVRHLVRAEDVHILVQSAALERRAKRILRDSGVSLASIRFHHWPTDRVWLRDSGGIFVTNPNAPRPEQLGVTTWRFNAWAKYSDWMRDALIPRRMAKELVIPSWRPEVPLAGRPHRLVLEGGSIDVNGRGALLTTRDCLLSRVQQRNPGVSRQHLEKAFADYLGAAHVIWLASGIVGDDTHGHVDDIARFVAARTVATAVELNRRDVNYRPLKENLARLKRSTDQDGKLLEILELPMPAPVVFKRRRLPASYANFYIANAVVLVPTFNDPNDRVALDQLGRVFPNRDVVGIYSGDFIWGFGAMHCMTQQQPAV